MYKGIHSDFVQGYIKFVQNRITELRMTKNWSEYRLSRELGKCNNYVQKITSHKIIPSLDAIFSICAVFGITPEVFFSGEEYDPGIPEISSIYKELPPEKKEVLLAVAKSLAGK